MTIRKITAFICFSLLYILAAKPAYAACKNLGDFCTAADSMCSATYECTGGTVTLKTSPVDQVDCSAEGVIVKGGSVTSCVGGFLTKAGLRNNTLEIGCAGREMIGGITTFCWQIPGTGIGKGLTMTIDLSTVTDDNIGQDSSGRYFTCFTGNNSDENVHDIFFAYKSKTDGKEICTKHIYTLDPNKPCMNDQCNTALGMISTKLDGPKNFISDMLTLSIGFGGVFALLLMLYGLYILITTAGTDMRRKTSGQDIIMSAVSGLIFIILSVIMLKVIGLDILGLPGL